MRHDLFIKEHKETMHKIYVRKICIELSKMTESQNQFKTSKWLTYFEDRTSW
jgi:hypothetical protein